VSPFALLKSDPYAALSHAHIAYSAEARDFATASLPFRCAREDLEIAMLRIRIDVVRCRFSTIRVLP
jgi:hypothetical protein